MPATHDSLTSASPPQQWEAWVRDWFSVLKQAPRESLAGHAGGNRAPGIGTGAAAGVDTPPHALVFAPHPDDECIVGALPLRLRQEGGWRVTNVAVTLGSRLERRAERLAELEAACEVLGFELRLLAADGFEQVKPEAADAGTPLWRAQVTQVAELLKAERPGLVLVPHAADGIPTHIGVHRLVTDALREARLSTVVAWTEFWATQDAPNTLVETGVADTARLVRALACHHGEIARNPYHLRLPAWMADNVRRGGELLAGAGEAPPPFGFATLYRLSRWVDGEQAADLPPATLACDLPLSFKTLIASPPP
ncbi:N-acetylglucosaminyl deacetylase, LmbE family [Roseateles sp. YR242]|uniref:PIG-L deacetylase family protein n=1 Tax=Roseateles sp. YR242 TaxID=1855305 RepID=UPI0008C70708|nr:PIG-L family deacetylase [Roseateles sp. YR242]SEL60947.1 N-acetylglucosaminyl deacetylase, LmbE family [Roseateles sp. YR242]